MKFIQNQDNDTMIYMEIGNHASLSEVLEEFQNFLRACGYMIGYDEVLTIVDIDE